MTTTRRDFLKAAAAAAVAVSLPGCATRRRDDRPDLVFILADDHRHDALGCAGHAWIRTPQLDRLAGGGVRFRNAFVTTSLCSPSRASFLTGAYAHTHQVLTNEDRDVQLPTFAQALQAAGYRTGFVGKWHQARWATPRPGFDYWASFNGQGSYRRNTFNVNGAWVVADEHVTDAITAHALDFLGRRDGRPRLLFIGHKAVHSPCVPAPRHDALYADVVIDPVVPQPGRRPPWAPPLPSIDPEAFWRGYARTLAGVDESVGRVLDQVGDDATVIYAGDNGFLCGEHGLWDKRAAYDASIRIPLLVRRPGVLPAGVVSEALALNLDVATTLLAAAGLPPGPDMRGLDLAAPVEREWFLYEHVHDDGDVPTTRAVRTRRHKLITYPENREYAPELYDLAADPQESRDLAADPASADLLAELTRWAAAAP